MWTEPDGQKVNEMVQKDTVPDREGRDRKTKDGTQKQTQCHSLAPSGILMKEDLQNKKGMFRKGNQEEELTVLDIFARVGQRAQKIMPHPPLMPTAPQCTLVKFTGEADTSPGVTEGLERKVEELMKM